MKKGNTKAKGGVKKAMNSVKEYMKAMLPPSNSKKAVGDAMATAVVVGKTPATKGSGKTAKATKNKAFKPKMQKMKAK